MRRLLMNKRMMFVAISLVFLALLAACDDPSPTPPALKVDPAGPLDFGSDVRQLFIVIDNAGKQTLHWSISATGGNGWLTVSPTEGVNRGTVTLTVDRAGLAPDTTYTAELTITSNGGEAHRTVTMSVPLEEPGPPLDEVRDLSVTGFTVPTGMLGLGVGNFGVGIDASGLYELVRQLDAPTAGPLFGTSSASMAGASSTALIGADRGPSPAGAWNGQASLPAGYEAGFVLSWEPVAEAEGYRVLVEDGAGNRTPVAELAADELEYGTDGYAIYVVSDGFDVGAQRTYTVQAFAAAREDGMLSASDTGVIIAPARLVAPADGETVSARPRFQWEEHPQGTAYGVYVATGSLENHVWHVVVAGGNVTDIRYPGDDPHAPSALAPGEYLWYIAARGPVINGKTGGIAVSVDSSFVVMEDDD